MNDPFVPRSGGIMSADIAVPEHERQLRFYSRVLTTGANPFWREDLMNNLGMPVIGLGKRPPEYEFLPLEWMVHIQVDDVAASAKRAVELGGRELMHGRDDDGNSEWAVLVDPGGAGFGIMPVVSPDAIPKVEGSRAEAGRIAWVDLTVEDAETTRDFYMQVVGWTRQDVEMKDDSGSYADFAMLGGDGQAAAGVCHARGGNKDLPSKWLIYLPVGDLVESVRRVREEGGEVIKEASGEGGGHAYAVVRDPIGVCFALLPG